MRAAGIAGAYHYSLPLHTELLRILRAERAALQAIEGDFGYRHGHHAGSVNALRQDTETAPIIVAKGDTESLPAIPDRQRLRAA